MRLGYIYTVNFTMFNCFYTILFNFVQFCPILFNFVQFCPILCNLFNFVLARMFYSLPAAAQVPRIQLKINIRAIWELKTFDSPIFLNIRAILELKTLEFSNIF